MKKNTVLKSFLLLIVVSLMIMGFTGCGAVIPICTTGTVNITTPNDAWEYWIYVDGVLWATTNWSGNVTLYNVPIGYHEFYALSTDWAWDGTAYATIICGVNNVPIYTFW